MIMSERVEFSDHGKMASFPLNNAVINFSCPGCGQARAFNLFDGKILPATFGQCPKCKAKMIPVSYSLDVDKMVSLLKKEQDITISFQ
jgi:hypothetical protein